MAFNLRTIQRQNSCLPYGTIDHHYSQIGHGKMMYNQNRYIEKQKGQKRILQ